MNRLGVSETLELGHDTITVAAAAVNLTRDTGCNFKGGTRSAFKTASRNFEQSTFNLNIIKVNWKGRNQSLMGLTSKMMKSRQNS